MPRTARIALAGLPHHLVQQGHNKEPLFLEEADYLFYLDALAECKKKLGCLIYWLCLMTNHVHLITDPGNDPANLGKLMKRVAGRYTRYVNRREGRTGTAWNGRYKSSPIETDLYLLGAGRYIDLNPVRAAMVVTPKEYRWSSYRHLAGYETIPWLDEHPLYVSLGDTAEKRQAAYRDWIRSSIPEGEWNLIRTATQHGHLIGSARFKATVERRMGRRLELRKPGRPKRRR